MSKTPDRVAECLDELRSVEEENEQLRASANAFADLAERLAERLKVSLELERRPEASGRDSDS